MHTIHADLQITRRKRVHYVMDQRDTLAFTDPALGPCLAWLHDQGESQFTIQTDQGAFLVQFTPLIGEAPTAPQDAESPPG